MLLLITYSCLYRLQIENIVIVPRCFIMYRFRFLFFLSFLFHRYWYTLCFPRWYHHFFPFIVDFNLLYCVNCLCCFHKICVLQLIYSLWYKYTPLMFHDAVSFNMDCASSLSMYALHAAILLFVYPSNALYFSYSTGQSFANRLPATVPQNAKLITIWWFWKCDAGQPDPSPIAK